MNDLSRELVVQRWAAPLSPTVRVFSPVIDKHHIYGVDGVEEIDIDFVGATIDTGCRSGYVESRTEVVK